MRLLFNLCCCDSRYDHSVVAIRTVPTYSSPDLWSLRSSTYPTARRYGIRHRIAPLTFIHRQPHYHHHLPYNRPINYYGSGGGLIGGRVIPGSGIRW